MTQRRNGGLLSMENRKRLVYLTLFTTFLFCLLIVQFYRIQIIEGDKWFKRAQAQHQLVVVEPYKRGTFYSNCSIKEGHPEILQPFVTDVPKFHLFADSLAIPEPLKKQVADSVASVFQFKDEDYKKLWLQLNKRSRSRKLVLWMSQEKKSQIESWWQKFAKEHKIPRNALFFVQEYKRSYPFGKLLGQILHTVREEKDPVTHQHIPTGGLEFVLNSYLKGKEGKRVLLRSPRNPLDLGTLVQPPENGADVFLTINHYLQAIAEEEIEKAVHKSNAKSGWAIMMDPYTGEILAWAQYPWFDPSRYRDYFNNPALEEHTKIKGITDPFEPGSTMKPLTIAICFKANEELKKRGKPPLFFPEEKVATANGYFPGRSKPIRDTRLHHFLNMNMALQKSSNIYMARMVQRIIDQLGDGWYRSALQDIFGFGIKTGIELTSESAGLLPTPGKKHPNGTLEWSKPTPFSMSFGHNILANSLQMVRAYAILANGGMDVKPTLIKKIVKTKEDGTVEVLLDQRKEREAIGKKRLIERESIEKVVKAMMYVTKPGGSAPKGDIFGYTEVGKTATSEKIVNGTYSKKDHISTFLGFAPAKNPRFVLMVVIDEPEYKYIPGVGKNQFGGNCAAPAFCEIGKRSLQYLGIEPDDPYGFPVGDPRRDPKKACWMKETNELKELYDRWNS
jgi:cell division protein FtsI (penicillin-binding protein 3)